MKTTLFTVNDVLDPEPVIVESACRTVIIGEDPSVNGWPTGDYRVKGIEAGSAWIQCAAGTKYTFQRISGQPAYSPGQTIGYVEMVTGSSTFQKTEQ